MWEQFILRQIAESVAATVKITAAVKMIIAAVTFRVTVTFKVNTAEITEAEMTADMNRVKSSAATAVKTVRSAEKSVRITDWVKTADTEASEITAEKNKTEKIAAEKCFLKALHHSLTLLKLRYKHSHWISLTFFIYHLFICFKR